MRALKSKAIVALLLLSSASGCSDFGEAAIPRGSRGAVVDSSAGTVALGLGRMPYREVAGDVSGTLAGNLSLQQAISDSVVAISRDVNVCGDSARVAEVGPDGNGLANALVWVSGVTSGKPLPEIRRERLTIAGCRFQPRVMGVTTGTTINVFSDDRAEHEVRFYREGAGEPVDHVRTFAAGSIVPSEKIAKAPGVVEARNRHHPWARAYIAVFNHPYFAVTDDKGAFRIDSLPPGTYDVKVWHERLNAPLQRRVTIAPNGTGRLDAALALR